MVDRVVADGRDGAGQRFPEQTDGAQHLHGGPGKSGARYPRFARFAVEPSASLIRPTPRIFPSARLELGQTYRHRMQFDFAPA